MKRKFIKMVIVLLITSMISVNFSAVEYSDVLTTHWAYDAVQYMQEHGYMVGSSSGEFLPKEEVTYFDMAEILARATGYQDEKINMNIKEQFKAEIKLNYEKKLPIINEYVYKYKVWQNSSNKEIAYLLGKRYLHNSELDNFVKTDIVGNQMAAFLKKEDLAVILVRILGKEQTAQAIYMPGSFTDELQIDAYKRPHVAYLKSLGIVVGNGKGKFGAGEAVTRSIMAQMTSDVLKLMPIVPIIPVEHAPIEIIDQGVSSSEIKYEGKKAIVNKLIPKNETEYYIVLEFKDENKTTFYSIDNNIIILNLYEEKMNVEDIQIGSEAEIIFDPKNETINIIKIQREKQNQEEHIETVKGNMLKVIKNQQEYILSMMVQEKQKEYIIGLDLEVLRNNKITDLLSCKFGDEITLKLQGNKITSVTANSTLKNISGKIQAINIKYKPELVVVIGETRQTFAVTPTTKIYDNKLDEEITVNELKLYSKITIQAESNEILKLTVEEYGTKLIYKGIIDTIEEDRTTMDILIEYDIMTNNRLFIKPVNIASETLVSIDGEQSHSEELKEGMEVLITYKSYEDLIPKEVIALN
ncbi:hypothetical protein AN639_03695 [Candidatus Epulonipiscium fishelsonii]|uniref:Uncharacterized protein n=1 Tax=Candidatus Epulonipiscium fishelsonii TaxID=77094 RepID=A0ACC8X7G3_9FIRM|nr:hypothetical protein AN396_12830 [Epulopiscium sp. SCG-B11WGA-EpuloA1]ONI41465.1 hypothetical protein AN639_03695 [Epulopiscium sp. SCG-B05WGA-EpuloA1]